MHGNAVRTAVVAQRLAAAALAALLVFAASAALLVAAEPPDQASAAAAPTVYTDLWAVHVEGGEEAARRVANRLGFTYYGEIMPDYYHFRRRDMQKRSSEANETHNSRLQADGEVKWFEQQLAKKRVKRDLIRFSDPKWSAMWYLHGGRSKNRSRLDMNVQQAWARGYTGKGVVVTILDDGLEADHPDLERNFDARASYDVNSRDSDPTPRYDNSNENRHGTRCAGEVAAVADNGICGVGVAHGASVGGIRMLDGDVTDSVEALALSYRREYIDIYSASWGPDDDGKTVDGPASLARKAFREGVAKGRGGKGSIFIWASGNGGRDRDNCNCDGYTNSIYTLSISSATESGQVPWYSEACSSTLATTYSSGEPDERQVITTDLRHGCTDSHTGTSASAPLAAGICALVLQANPNLTWRDMQHIVVMTSNPAGLQATVGSGGWKRNGVGRNVSDNFGYGMMDAAAMINLALNWTTVPEQHVCEIESPRSNELIQPSSKLVMRLPVDGCSSDSNRYVRYLEHVQVKMSLMTPRRGDISIYLTSPSGTTSTLLARRQNDNNKIGFNEWSFMTTHCWGELAQGTWHLEVHNGYRTSATLRTWSLILHGTSENPAQQQQQQSRLQSPKTGSSTDNGGGSRQAPLAEDCELGFVAHGNRCLEKCPDSFYPQWKEEVSSGGGRCLPCGRNCRTCRDGGTRCLACHTGHMPASTGGGTCVPSAAAGGSGSPETGSQGRGTWQSGDRGAAAPAASGQAPADDRLSTGTLWWLMIVATLAVCVLLFLLVLLAMYYAHAQGYICESGRANSSCMPTGGSNSSDSSAGSGGGSSSFGGGGVRGARATGAVGGRGVGCVEIRGASSSSCESTVEELLPPPSAAARTNLIERGGKASDRSCLPRSLHSLAVPLLRPSAPPVVATAATGIAAAHSSQAALVTSAAFSPAYSPCGHLTRV